MNSWFVYLVQTECGALYCGITTDVERRFAEHCAVYFNKGKKGAKYFRGKKPQKVVYQAKYQNRSLASKREAELKRLPAKAKQQLILEQT